MVRRTSRERRPGEFARQRFRERRRAWLGRVWWIVALASAGMFAVIVAVGAVFAPDDLGFYLGLGLGSSATFAFMALDEPPFRIARWREGADGERNTARALRPLVRREWSVLHDIDIGRGNIDHVLVGPPGVFLLETKNLAGLVTVASGVLTVRWREDPNDGYDQPRIAPRVRAAAAEVSRLLATAGHARVWVQPAVVLWASFEQRSVQSGDVAWIRGNDLAEVLKARPARLDDEQVRDITRCLRSRFEPDPQSIASWHATTRWNGRSAGDPAAS